jgi:hypothetical protein
MATPGFYRFLDDTLQFGTKIYAPNYTLLAEDHETYSYPVEGWRWFDTIQEAEVFFQINGAVTGHWLEFGAALAQNSTMNAFFLELSQQAPILDRMLSVGMGQAAKGDSHTFLMAWQTGISLGVITPAVQAHLAALASGYDLPAEFMAGLAA